MRASPLLDAVKYEAKKKMKSREDAVLRGLSGWREATFHQVSSTTSRSTHLSIGNNDEVIGIPNESD